jgi:hypothetical protein
VVLIKRSIAVLGVVSATLVMWLDAAIGWWRWIVEFVFGARVDEFESARGRFGDADLHALVWSAVAIAVAIAVPRAHWWRWLLALATWSLVVEALQPVFAGVRQRQAIDVVGNLAGVGVVAIVVFIVQRRRERRIVT